MKNFDTEMGNSQHDHSRKFVHVFVEGIYSGGRLNTYPARTRNDYSLCHQCTVRGQPALRCSLTRQCTAGWPTSNSHFDFPKIDNGQFQKWKVDKSI